MQYIYVYHADFAAVIAKLLAAGNNWARLQVPLLQLSYDVVLLVDHKIISCIGVSHFIEMNPIPTFIDSAAFLGKPENINILDL